jgi:hypothetical protein
MAQHQGDLLNLVDILKTLQRKGSFEKDLTGEPKCAIIEAY